MLFMWQPFTGNFGSQKQILTHILHNNYGPPPDFSNEQNAWDEVIPYSNYLEYNLDYRCVSLQTFVNDIADSVPNKRTMMVLFGDDFTFQNAFMSYRGLDKLIDYCNKNQKTNMQFKYSTPGKYLDALKLETGVEYKVVKHDFFPYYQDRLRFWSGFFTSRPDFKK